MTTKSTGAPAPTHTREQILAMSDEQYAEARKALSEQSKSRLTEALANERAARTERKYGGSR